MFRYNRKGISGQERFHLWPEVDDLMSPADVWGRAFQAEGTARTNAVSEAGRTRGPSDPDLCA